MGKQAKPTTETTQPPAFVSAAQQSMLGNIQGTLSPYMMGNNFNPDQLRAYEMTRQEAENPTQLSFTGMGRTPIEGVDPLVPATMSAAYTPAATAAGAQLDPSSWQPFYNPYQQNVIDTTLAQSRNELNKDLNAVRGRAAAGSAFGGSGSRAALQEGQLRSDYDRNSAALIAQLKSQGFSDANARAFANTQLQQQTNLANAGFEQQARLANASNAQQAMALNATNQQAASAATQEAGLRRVLAQAGFDQTTDQFNASGANSMAVANASLRSQALQNLLGIGTQQFQAPLEAAKVMAAAIPQQYGGTTTKSAPQGPSMLQQLLGVGLSLGGAPMTGGGSLFGLLGSGLFGGSKG